MNRILAGVMAAALAMAGASAAFAESKTWHTVGEVTVNKKDAAELSIDRPSVTLVRIVCTDGSVVINTLVVREGGKKTPYTVGKRIEKDGYEIIRMDETPATGFRISHDGRGSYKVQVR
jgi:hypothetical protein